MIQSRKMRRKKRKEGVQETPLNNPGGPPDPGSDPDPRREGKGRKSPPPKGPIQSRRRIAEKERSNSKVKSPTDNFAKGLKLYLEMKDLDTYAIGR